MGQFRDFITEDFTNSNIGRLRRDVTRVAGAVKDAVVGGVKFAGRITGVVKDLGNLRKNVQNLKDEIESLRTKKQKTRDPERKREINLQIKKKLDVLRKLKRKTTRR